jgi:heme exporter protein B
MNTIWGAWRILSKDVAQELAHWETLTILLVFSRAVLCTFAFSFEIPRKEASGFMPGFFWLTVLFASVLHFLKEMAVEGEAGGMEGVLLAPISRGALFLGKAAGALLFLLAVELILMPLFFLFLELPLEVKRLPPLLAPMALGAAGLAVLGTFVAGICRGVKKRGVLFSLGYFPLAVPILIAGTKLTQGILESDGALQGLWIRFLPAVDLIYLVLSLLLFEYLVEE